MKDKLKYLGKNTLLFALSSFSTKILLFLLVPLYTSVLTTAEYGTADLITTTASLLIYVLTLNIADAVTRYTLDIQYQVEDKNRRLEKKFKQESILSYGNRVILISTLICSLILGIVYWSNQLSWPVYYYFFIVAYFFATAFYQLLSNYLRGIDRVSAVAISGVLSSLIAIICNILFLVVFKLGIVGYLLAMILGPIGASVYSICIIGASVKVYLFNTCSKSLQKEMLQYCIPLIFNNVALWINASLDRYFVTGMCGIRQNGIYSVAMKIPTILAVFYSVFGQAWNLSAIKDFDSEDKDGFFGKTYTIYNATMVVLCSLLVLLNIPLAKFLYSKDFFLAWNYSSILLISTLFNALTMFIGSVFSAVKRTKVIAWTTVISAIINTLLNIVLIPFIGALGAAISTVVSYAVMWGIRLVYSRKYITFKVNLFRDIIAYFLLCLQVVFEHTENHLYLGQILCILLIILIYRKYLSSAIQKIYNRG